MMYVSNNMTLHEHEQEPERREHEQENGHYNHQHDPEHEHTKENEHVPVHPWQECPNLVVLSRFSCPGCPTLAVMFLRLSTFS
jgi:hypothetical protein